MDWLFGVILPVGISALFLLPAVRWPTAGRALIGLMFLGGAAFNALSTLPDADGMLAILVATAPIPPYREAVQVATAWHLAGALVLAVILFETATGCVALWRGPWARVALLAAGAWGLGMLPVVPPGGIALGVALTGAPGLAGLILARGQYPESVWAVAARHLRGPRHRAAHA